MKDLIKCLCASSKQNKKSSKNVPKEHIFGTIMLPKGCTFDLTQVTFHSGRGTFDHKVGQVLYGHKQFVFGDKEFIICVIIHYGA